MSTGFLALSLARPGAGWALALPPLFLLLLRLFERAPLRVTGTLELWKELAPAAPRGTRARGRLPTWAFLCAAGLACGALSWIGLRPAATQARELWTLVVDLSPSMGLATRVGGPTRLDAALEAAEGWFAANASPRDRVRWVAEGRTALELAPGERPGVAWLDAGGDGREPDWARHDRTGTLWVTDRVPPGARGEAGLIASGGVEVEGPIVADGRMLVLWQGGVLREVPNPGPAPAVILREPPGAPLPGVLERVVAAWCEARGYELRRAPRAGTILVIERLTPAGSEIELTLGRDGWRAAGRGTRLPPVAAEEPEPGVNWLLGTDSSGASVEVLRARVGSLVCSLDELSEPGGDPALFALSWARLLDAFARRPHGIVPLTERLAAGEASVFPGKAAPAGLDRAALDARRGAWLDAGLALGAALCAVLAALLGLRR